MLVRHTVAAIAITLAVFLAIQILWAAVVRPHLIPSVRTTQPLSIVSFSGIGVSNDNRPSCRVAAVQGRRGDWVVGGSQAVSATGRPVSFAPAGCPQLTNMIPCVARNGILIQVTYEPARRYWEFQWLETGIFLILAASLAITRGARKP